MVEHWPSSKQTWNRHKRRVRVPLALRRHPLALRRRGLLLLAPLHSGGSKTGMIVAIARGALSWYLEIGCRKTFKAATSAGAARTNRPPSVGALKSIGGGCLCDHACATNAWGCLQNLSCRNKSLLSQQIKLN